MKSSLSALAALVPFLLVLMLGWPPEQSRGEGPAPNPVSNPTSRSIETPTINLLSQLKGRAITSLCFSLDGKTLAAGNRDGVLRFIDSITTRDCQPVWDARTTESIKGLIYSPDGLTLAFISHTEIVTLLDVATRRVRNILRVPPTDRSRSDSLQTLAYAPDGKTLAGAGSGGQILVWDVTSGEVMRAVMRGPIVPPPRRLPNSKVLGKPARVFDLAFAPDGKTLAAAAEDAVRLWDVAEGQERLVFDVPGSHISLVFAPDGKTLAVTGTVGPLLDRESLVLLCDTANGKQRTMIHGPMGRGFTHIKFVSDGKLLASLASGMIQLWDVTTGQQKSMLEIPFAAFAFAVSRDGKTLAVGGFHNHPMFGVIDLIDIDGTTLRHRPGPR